MASTEALGRLFDLQVGVAPLDMNGAAGTGKYVSVTRNTGITVVFIKAKGATGAGDPTLTLKESKDNVGTGVQNLAVITKYYKKIAATLGGTETWTKVTQNAAATIALAAGEGAGDQGIYAFYVHCSQLDAGYEFIRVDTSQVSGSSTAELGTVLYVPGDLSVQRTPPNLAASGT